MITSRPNENIWNLSKSNYLSDVFIFQNQKNLLLIPKGWKYKGYFLVCYIAKKYDLLVSLKDFNISSVCQFF